MPWVMMLCVEILTNHTLGALCSGRHYFSGGAELNGLKQYLCERHQCRSSVPCSFIPYKIKSLISSSAWQNQVKWEKHLWICTLSPTVLLTALMNTLSKSVIIQLGQAGKLTHYLARGSLLVTPGRNNTRVIQAIKK